LTFFTERRKNDTTISNTCFRGSTAISLAVMSSSNVVNGNAAIGIKTIADGRQKLTVKNSPAKNLPTKRTAKYTHNG